MNFKLDHVNISVKNLSDSVDWYQKIFGLEKVEGGIKIDGSPWAILSKNDVSVCMTQRPSWKKSAEGTNQINHFGFRVNDEDEWKKKVKEHKLKLYYGGVNEYPNSRSWYLEDPTGHSIEVSYSDSPHLIFPS